MKRLKLSICTLLIIAIGMTFFLSGFASGLDSSTLPSNGQYIITEKYEYPIVPGTSKWKSFQTSREMADACQIPDDILSKMTTKALVLSVMDYPLLFDMGAYSTKQEGFDSIYSSFNGLQELARRSDGLTELQNYKASLDAIKNKNIEIKSRAYHLKLLLFGLGNKEQTNSIIIVPDKE